MISWLNENDPFPDPETALANPNGLLAGGGDLSVGRLLSAYRQGIFPWFNPGEPILWWAPDPRMVLFPEEFKLSRSLRRRLKRGSCEIRVDGAFSQVMMECAAPRAKQKGTWISPVMMAAYTRLHRMGHAHCVETWMEGELVGGLYGVAIGRVFFGESMFSRRADASKLALAHLVFQLRRWGYGLIDCQIETDHLASLGARPIPRSDFRKQLDVLVNFDERTGAWTFDHDLFA